MSDNKVHGGNKPHPAHSPHKTTGGYTPITQRTRVMQSLISTANQVEQGQPPLSDEAQARIDRLARELKNTVSDPKKADAVLKSAIEREQKLAASGKTETPDQFAAAVKHDLKKAHIKGKDAAEINKHEKKESKLEGQPASVRADAHRMDRLEHELKAAGVDPKNAKKILADVKAKEAAAQTAGTPLTQEQFAAAAKDAMSAHHVKAKKADTVNGAETHRTEVSKMDPAHRALAHRIDNLKAELKSQGVPAGKIDKIAKELTNSLEANIKAGSTVDQKTWKTSIIEAATNAGVDGLAIKQVLTREDFRNEFSVKKPPVQLNPPPSPNDPGTTTTTATDPTTSTTPATTTPGTTTTPATPPTDPTTPPATTTPGTTTNPATTPPAATGNGSEPTFNGFGDGTDVTFNGFNGPDNQVTTNGFGNGTDISTNGFRNGTDVSTRGLKA